MLTFNTVQVHVGITFDKSTKIDKKAAHHVKYTTFDTSWKNRETNEKVHK